VRAEKKSYQVLGPPHDLRVPRKMAPTKPSKKDKRVRPKLTQAQKEARKEKIADLTNAIDDARNFYQDAACDIAEKYGR
jgi:hypothetical protein